MMLKQSENIIPFNTFEIAFRQHVCELLLGVNIFDFDFGVQVVKYPIKSDSAGSGHVSHRRTSAFTDHFDHGFVVFKIVQLGFEVIKFCACDNVVLG